MTKTNGHTPRITLTSPFPRSDYAAVFLWAKRHWGRLAGADTVEDASDWIAFQSEREQYEGLKTWGVYYGDDLGGYVEAQITPESGEFFAQAATVRFLFKQAFWGLKQNTRPGLSLALDEILSFEIADLALFPAMQGDRHVQQLLRSVNARIMGAHGQEEGRALLLYSLTRVDWEQQRQPVERAEKRPAPAPSVEEETVAVEAEHVEPAVVSKPEAPMSQFERVEQMMRVPDLGTSHL